MNRARRLRERIVVPVDAARRKFLFAFGVAYLGISLSYMFAEADVPVRVALKWTGIPFWILGLLWAVCGLVAIASSFVPTIRDKPGFSCLSVPPTLWAIAYLIAEALTMVSNYQAPRAWVSTVVFGVIAYAVDVVSGMVDARLVAKDGEAQT